MPRLPFRHVHLAGRPCRLAAGIGEIRSWRPSRVTCDECRPAAEWIAEHAGGGAFAVGLGSLVFCLALL